MARGDFCGGGGAVGARVAAGLEIDELEGCFEGGEGRLVEIDAYAPARRVDYEGFMGDGVGRDGGDGVVQG